MYKNSILSIPEEHGKWPHLPSSSLVGDENWTKFSIFWTFHWLFRSIDLCYFKGLSTFDDCFNLHCSHLKIDSKNSNSPHGCAKNIEVLLEFIWLINFKCNGLHKIQKVNTIHVFEYHSIVKFLLVKCNKKKCLSQMYLLSMGTHFKRNYTERD